MAFILFDIGGTNMRVAASFDGKTVGAAAIRPTPQDFEAGIVQFVDLAKWVSAGTTIEGIAGGMAGEFNDAHTELLYSPNLLNWVGKPLAEEIKRRLGAPVFIENDTVMEGLGEAHFGAARGEEIVVYLTVSTGIGGARIVGGRVDDKRVGFEPGKQIIERVGRKTLESLVSGRAFEKRFGKKPYEVSDEKVWEDSAKTLAIGLHNTIVFWSPDVIVLGGRMITGNPAIPFTSIVRWTAEYLRPLPGMPRLERAELDERSGLYGSLVYLKQNH